MTILKYFLEENMTMTILNYFFVIFIQILVQSHQQCEGLFCDFDQHPKTDPSHLFQVVWKVHCNHLFFNASFADVLPIKHVWDVNE